MPKIHHTAITTTDVEASLRFWRDGIGMAVLMDEHFDGDWPTLLGAPGTRLRSVFLGDPADAGAGVIELVDLGVADGSGAPVDRDGPPAPGVLLVSLFADVDAVLDRLAGLGLGGEVRRIVVSGVDMAVVHDPDGVAVELLQPNAAANLDRLTGPGDDDAGGPDDTPAGG